VQAQPGRALGVRPAARRRRRGGQEAQALVDGDLDVPQRRVVGHHVGGEDRHEHARRDAAEQHAETRPLAQEWTYRFLAAAAAESVADDRAAQRLAALVTAEPLAPAPASVATVRRWAMQQGLPVSDRGRLRAHVRAAYEQAQQ